MSVSTNNFFIVQTISEKINQVSLKDIAKGMDIIYSYFRGTKLPTDFYITHTFKDNSDQWKIEIRNYKRVVLEILEPVVHKADVKTKESVLIITSDGTVVDIILM